MGAENGFANGKANGVKLNGVSEIVSNGVNGELVRSNGVKNGGPKSERKELLYDGWYYDVTEWMKTHPGGSIIKFYTEKGEDATLPIQQFHNRATKKVMAIMKSLRSRPALPSDILPEPEDTVTAERHRELTADFVRLFREFEAEGLFEPDYLHVIFRITEATAFAVIGSLLTFAPSPLLKILGYLLICSFIGRSGWLMHEGGHYSLTGILKVDRIISIIFYGMGFGLSSCWWRRNHNMHHSQTNRFGRDVDIDTYPLYAFNKICIKEKDPKKAGFLVRNQANMFLLFSNWLGFMILKFVLNPPFLAKKRVWGDILCILTHYAWMISLPWGILGYAAVFWVVSNYFYTNFSLSHTHLPFTNHESKNKGQLHWVEYAFLTTMDITPTPMVNWWMGYLNFQIEHHLFPSMPQFRHPLIADRVRDFAHKHGLPYHCEGYFAACKLTFANMKKVSDDIVKS